MGDIEGRGHLYSGLIKCFQLLGGKNLDVASLLNLSLFMLQFLYTHFVLNLYVYNYFFLSFFFPFLQMGDHLTHHCVRIMGLQQWLETLDCKHLPALAVKNPPRDCL